VALLASTTSITARTRAARSIPRPTPAQPHLWKLAG
jgi:hypothetical protein